MDKIEIERQIQIVGNSKIVRRRGSPDRGETFGQSGLPIGEGWYVEGSINWNGFPIYVSGPFSLEDEAKRDSLKRLVVLYDQQDKEKETGNTCDGLAGFFIRFVK